MPNPADPLGLFGGGGNIMDPLGVFGSRQRDYRQDARFQNRDKNITGRVNSQLAGVNNSMYGPGGAPQWEVAPGSPLAQRQAQMGLQQAGSNPNQFQTVSGMMGNQGLQGQAPAPQPQAPAPQPQAPAPQPQAMPNIQPPPPGASGGKGGMPQMPQGGMPQAQQFQMPQMQQFQMPQMGGGGMPGGKGGPQ